MQRAIETARRNNPRAPFGSILVDSATNEVVAEGFNRSRSNPILHGEIDVINCYAANEMNHWSRLRLYTTAEPCCMCQAAIIWARIPEVVFGTSIATLTRLGWRQFELTAAVVASKARFTRCDIRGGVLEDGCDQLFKRAKS